MSKKNTAPRLGNMAGGVSSLMASLMCILIGLAVGFVVLLVLGGVTLAQEGSAFSFGELLKTTWIRASSPSSRAASIRRPIPWAWACVWKSSRLHPWS